MQSNRSRLAISLAALILLATSLLGAAGCARGGKTSGCCGVCHQEDACEKSEPVRYGMVIKLKPEKYDEYKRLHANAWPEVLKKISECNIRNYSIYHRDGYLFSYFEYVGEDFDADMEKMAADPKTQEWWKATDPCQQPVESAGEGEWWAPMEELFHHGG